MGKGQNVWFDLMTTDMEAAKGFYGEVIGWKNQQWEDADPNMPYTMWMNGDTSIGGVMPLPEEAAKMGAPPHWIAYTTVEDVDAAVAKTEKLGGRVHQPAFDIPKVGRIAILADPQGASFAVFKPVDEMDQGPEVHGKFSWAELNTTDMEGAWTFYSDLFGWDKRGEMESPGGPYRMFQTSDMKTKGGMSNMAKQMNMPAHWLHYITVDDMDATIERIKKQGGKILNGPMDIPGDDVIAQCMDPQGAAFAIYCEKSKK